MERAEALSTLKGMFPDVDPEVQEAVFDSNQSLEQTINALLGMSDPNYKIEEAIPAQTESGYLSSREQIERDEELARSLAAEADRLYDAQQEQYRQQQQQQRQQQEQQQQSSFPDLSEELPIIKEKIGQAFDTTKRKAKEWYDKLKQQSASSRDETTQYSTPHYTSLPGYEADNPLLGEDFSPLKQQKNNDRQDTSTTSTTSTTSNTNNTRSSPLKSQPVYGSYGIDVNKDTNDDDVFSSSTNSHQIKIIREDQNQSLVSDSTISPYKVNENIENSTNNDNSASTITPYDVHKDTEEVKKNLDLNNS